MSMRPDMLPGDVVEALKSLCDASPEHQFNHTRRMFLEAFNRDIEDVFETFEESPVASGSVAQVHRARLKTEYALPDGAVDVAVKGSQKSWTPPSVSEGSSMKSCST